jgi:hypothetical protein
MKKILAVILFVVLLQAGCRKGNDTNTSGSVTIDNRLYGTTDYYALGFTFSNDSKISTHGTPGPDITVDNDGTLGDVRLLDNNFTNSFYKIGGYSSSATASQVFDTLKSPVVLQWVVWADSIKANQVLIFKTSDDHYAKLRIVSTVSEVRESRNYAECTFEWVYQPDGSLTFPGK